MDVSEQLLAAIHQLTEATRRSASLQATSKAPELWSEDDIATWLEVSITSVKRMAARPGFPEPFCPVSTDASKRYFADEVIEFVRLNKGNVPSKRTGRPRETERRAA